MSCALVQLAQKGDDRGMGPSLRVAECQECEWRAMGSSAWSAADVHAADTGHEVRKVTMIAQPSEPEAPSDPPWPGAR
jgi:hypothetical protein